MRLMFYGFALVSVINLRAHGQSTNTSGNYTTSNGTQSSCLANHFTCANGNCVEQHRVCDGTDSCGDGSDENVVLCKTETSYCWPWQAHCNLTSCESGLFQCNNGKCINITKVCDKTDHCGDGTDEMRYTTGLKCSLGIKGDTCVLPQRHVRDGFAHCTNEEDESETEDGSLRLFRCFDKSKLLTDMQMCDGIIDCPDLSDECRCENGQNQICRNLCKTTSGSENCTFRSISCADGSEILPNQVCDGKLDCPGGMDERHCSNHSRNRLIVCPGDVNNTTQKLARLCDGRPECFDLSDECSSRCGNVLPGYCELQRSSVPFHYHCNTSTASYNLTVEHVCDGTPSPCNISWEETGCTGRHYCKTKDLISIDKSLLCNGYAECQDESDEEGCNNRYSCRRKQRGPKTVPVHFVLDGVTDCNTGIDECPVELNDRPVGSQRHLLGLDFFRVWIWIVGLSCIFGNSYIILNKLRRFKTIRESGGLAKCNHFLVLNLALADLLMGIYLLGIAFKEVLTSGRYCRHDVRWRTSPVCYWLGATAVVSSEASLFMLTILTSLRLASVRSPLRFRNVKVKSVAVPVLIAWTAAICIGFLPITNVSQYFFTRGAFVKSKFISSTMVGRSGMYDFAIALSSVSENATAPPITRRWSLIEDYLSQNFPRIGIARYYGYYSEYSVCMPNFYVTKTDKMWAYSFSIITIDFCIFIYISAAYVAIYKMATRSKVPSTESNRRSSLQKKVVRIIISDMLCWVPICIITFLTLSGKIVSTTGRLYAITAVIILPINSVLNPLLYSDLIDVIWQKRTLLKNCFVLPGKDMIILNTRSSNLPHEAL